eukprot:772090-Alexandrium_andersonii.AAC.1
MPKAICASPALRSAEALSVRLAICSALVISSPCSAPTASSSSISSCFAPLPLMRSKSSMMAGGGEPLCCFGAPLP